MTRPLRFLINAAAALALAAPLARVVSAQETEEKTKLKPFETAQLSPNVWYGRFGFTNCAWMDVGDGVLLVDTAGTAGDTANLKAEIKRTTNGKPIRWIVVTHLHEDSNGGLPALLPADVTIYANKKVAAGLAAGVEKKSVPGKHTTVVGVTDRLLLYFGSHPFELFIPRGAAHTDHDLVAFAPEVRAAFVGDLVTPGRCPMMSDPNTDPAGWLDALDDMLALQPAVLIATRGDAAIRPDPKVPAATAGLDLNTEIGATRAYIDRVVKTLTDLKKEKAPEARVASELKIQRIGGSYCPGELDTINALTLYRRMTPDGNFTPGAPPRTPPAK